MLQVKELLKKEVEQSDGEQARSAAIVAEYKTICSQLSQRIDSEHQQHQQQMQQLRVGNSM